MHITATRDATGNISIRNVESHLQQKSTEN